MTFSGDTRNGGTSTLADSVVFVRGPSTGSGGVHKYDDIYITDSGGIINNGYLGDIRVYARFPDGNGNYSQLLGSDGNSVDNYLLVDENPDPNTSDYVGSGTPGQIDTYTMADIPSGIIKAVVQRSYMAKSDAGARTARNVVRIASMDYTSSDFSLNTSYAQQATFWDASPASTVAWTSSEVNSAEFGVEVRS
jgi:hypothetical protein